MRRNLRWVLLIAIAFTGFGSASGLAAVLTTRDTGSECTDTVPRRPVEAPNSSVAPDSQRQSCVTGEPTTAAVVGAALVGGTAGAVGTDVFLRRFRGRREDKPLMAGTFEEVGNPTH